jgi:hypothetical protein
MLAPAHALGWFAFEAQRRRKQSEYSGTIFFAESEYQLARYASVFCQCSPHSWMRCGDNVWLKKKDEVQISGVNSAGEKACLPLLQSA